MTGLVGLTRFSLRRSRLLVLAWTTVFVVITYASASATGSLYASAAAQVSAARDINSSPALVALYGPILDVHSLGEIAMTKTTVTYGVLVMALCLALVRRHTRVEEESGRAELLGGLAVAAFAALEGGDRVVQGRLVELRPQLVAEEEFCVGALP
jgi:ABC-2 type transport system permease protein